MARNVKVILLEDIASLGLAGDIVDVSEGYARNALFPDGKAALATESVQAKAEKESAKQAAEKEKALLLLQEKAESLNGTELVLEVKVKEADELYGSITKKHVAQELHAQAKVEVKAKDIAMQDPIKTLGTYDAEVSLSPEVQFSLQINIIPDEDSKKRMQASQDEE